MKKYIEEFKAFALKGNMVDLAVGMIIGSAFTSIVNSLVNDIFMPFRRFSAKGLCLMCPAPHTEPLPP